jgi:hypothetical protein
MATEGALQVGALASALLVLVLILWSPLVFNQHQQMRIIHYLRLANLGMGGARCKRSLVK